MNLTPYLKELLYQHECVTLPNFGSFLTQTAGIKVNRLTGEFIAPKRSLSFNRLIQQNDGVLASYVAQREGLSYPDALEAITKEISRWNNRLSADLMVLPGIGEFSKTSENKLRFLPYGEINFDAQATGLHDFQRKPLKAQLQAASIVPPVIPQPDNSTPNNMQKENLAFTPEQPEEKSSSTMKYAAIGIIAVALLGASYYFGNQYLESERLKSTELAQKRITKNVQEARFDLGAIAGLTVNVPAEIETVEDTTIPIESGSFYSVIAGSFRDQINAERKLAALKAQGFDAAYAESSADGLYRVAYGRFETKREAFSMLSFIQLSLEEEAWYLVEGY